MREIEIRVTETRYFRKRVKIGRLKPSDCLAPAPQATERASEHLELSAMHRGNRFRLMFGMARLPEDP